MAVGFCSSSGLGGRGPEGCDRDEGRAEVADLGEQAVQLGLVAHGAAKGGGAVVLVGDGEAVEPGRPVLVQVPADAQLIGGGSVGWSWSHDAPTRAVRARLARRTAGRRMIHSAMARLMAQAAAIMRSVRTTPVPKSASPNPTVNAWVPAPSASAYARVIQAR